MRPAPEEPGAVGDAGAGLGFDWEGRAGQLGNPAENSEQCTQSHAPEWGPSSSLCITWELVTDARFVGPETVGDPLPPPTDCDAAQL